MNPLGGGGPLRYTRTHTHTHRQSLAGEVTCPLCKSCGRGEADKHGSAAEQDAMKIQLSYIQVPFFGTLTEVNVHTLTERVRRY